MTPTPKHIEEAQRLANEACDKLRFTYPGTLFYIRIPETAKDLSKHLNLPTLLAAQEKLETIRADTVKRMEAYADTMVAEAERRFTQEEVRRISYLNKLATWATQDPTGPVSAEGVRAWVLEQIKGAFGQQPESTCFIPSIISEVETLRTHNAALLAVARAARNHRSCGENCEIRKALSALEPLGIKV